jgi:hypothetical protein
MEAYLESVDAALSDGLCVSDITSIDWSDWQEETLDVRYPEGLALPPPPTPTPACVCVSLSLSMFKAGLRAQALVTAFTPIQTTSRRGSCLAPSSARTTRSSGSRRQ